MWDDDGLDAPSSNVRTVVFLVDAYYEAVLHQTAGILLKGPSLVLGESYPDVSIMKQLKHPLYSFHPFSNISDF